MHSNIVNIEKSLNFGYFWGLPGAPILADFVGSGEAWIKDFKIN